MGNPLSLRDLVDPRNFDGLAPGMALRQALMAAVPVEPPRTPDEDRAGPRLPGDPVDCGPFDGLAFRPQEAARLLRESDDPGVRRRALAAVAAYEASTGETVSPGGPPHMLSGRR